MARFWWRDPGTGVIHACERGQVNGGMEWISECGIRGDYVALVEMQGEPGVGDLVLEDRTTCILCLASVEGCEECYGRGVVVDSDNNDLPCHCPAGDKAVFSVAGHGLMTGEVMRKRGLC